VADSLQPDLVLQLFVLRGRTSDAKQGSGRWCLLGEELHRDLVRADLLRQLTHSVTEQSNHGELDTDANATHRVTSTNASARLCACVNCRFMPSFCAICATMTRVPSARFLAT
jgi:hypothetical protein